MRGDDERGAARGGSVTRDDGSGMRGILATTSKGIQEATTTSRGCEGRGKRQRCNDRWRLLSMGGQTHQSTILA